MKTAVMKRISALKSTCTNSSWSNRLAATTVELAIVLPLFMSVTLGIVEFGRAMMVTQIISSAAREGCRIGVIDGTTNEQVATVVKNYMQAAAKVNGSDVNVTITVTPDIANKDPGNQLALSNGGDLVTITVSVPMSKVQYITGKFLGDTNLMGISTMRHE
jgi:Flp pilus assembly protein TadG